MKAMMVCQPSLIHGRNKTFLVGNMMERDNMENRRLRRISIKVIIKNQDFRV